VAGDAACSDGSDAGLGEDHDRDPARRGQRIGVLVRVRQVAGKGEHVAGRERVALAGREVVLSAEETRVRDALDRVLRDAALMPPDQDRLAALTSSPPELVEQVLRLMVRHKRIVVVGGLPFHQQALDALKGDVAALRQTGAEAYVDIASFKSRYGLSRKFAIPLLEYLDRERVTRRVGERRLVL